MLKLPCIYLNDSVRKGSSVKVAVYISQESVRKGRSVKVAVYISQESEKK